MNRLLASLTASVAAAAVLTACGGGDDQNSADAPAASESPSESTSAPAPSEAEGSPGVDAANAPGAGTRYCDLLQTDFPTLFSSIKTPGDVNKAVGVISEIAGEAPKDVKTEWATMEGAIGQMKGALTEATKLQQQAEAGKLTQKQLQEKSAELMKSMQSLNTPENNEAGTAVTKHAADYCGVNLG